MIGRIYIIKNRTNNKVYIGQTIQSISHRFSQHKENANTGKKGHLYSAMRKYGISNFYVELIEDNIEKDELTNKEEYWIRYYDSVNNGYNLKYRVEDCRFSTITLVGKDVLETLYEKYSSIDIAKMFNVSHTAVLNRLKALGIIAKKSGTNYDSYIYDSIITKDLLEELYIKENRTIAYIADKLNVKQCVIRFRLKRYDIKKIPGVRRSMYKDLEPKIIELKKQGLSFSKIAEQLNCSEEPLRIYYNNKIRPMLNGGTEK